jgi:P27 family predicted phage terminase small subunit
MKPGPIPKNNVTELKTSGNNKPRYIAPECPPHLQGSARAEWVRIIVFLEKYKLITEIDTAALALYCAAYGRWQDAEESMRRFQEKKGGDPFMVKTPNGFFAQNPYLAIINRAMEDCHKYLQQFGLSPAARTRVSTGMMQGSLFPDDEADKKYFT